VSAQESDTAVVLLPGDRAAAERAAQAIVQLFEVTPGMCKGRGASIQVTLAFGVIAFPPAGPYQSAQVSASQLDTDSATPVTV
jgi:hypothetical protein